MEISDQAFSSSSRQQQRGGYEVFLSFRGKDTRDFADHLYSAISRAGVFTFRDDDRLERGNDISIELVKAIQESRISLIVFSRNYAGSSWCLGELVKIMECKNTVQQVVLPIFYDVDPSEVSKQEGSFGEAFAELKERFVAEMNMVSRWRAALTEAANISGWLLTSSQHRYVAKVIKSVVEKILAHLNYTYLNVALYPVGIDSRVRCMDFLLMVRLDNVRIVGICAMGGMGKTTIAKAVYNQFFHTFEGKSFLRNVRETAKVPNDLVCLQEQLLFDILEDEKIKIGNIGMGINLIKERLCQKKVLVVLDDVDHSQQIEAIAGKRDWFGAGSRIIITTSDEHLLNQIGVDGIYMVQEMNNDESRELFSWHAFRKAHPKKDYAELSKDVIGYCKGLPLALEVLGSYLFGRNVSEWESALKKLRKIPHHQIQEKLRISFDDLNVHEKDIFLDIACFFNGMGRNFVAQVLNCYGFSSEIGISVLVDRCFIKIIDDKLMMHDLLRDMGREIVRKENPERHRGRSSEAVRNVLEKQRMPDKDKFVIEKIDSDDDDDGEGEGEDDIYEMPDKDMVVIEKIDNDDDDGDGEGEDDISEMLRKEKYINHGLGDGDDDDDDNDDKGWEMLEKYQINGNICGLNKKEGDYKRKISKAVALMVLQGYDCIPWTGYKRYVSEDCGVLSSVREIVFKNMVKFVLDIYNEEDFLQIVDEEMINNECKKFYELLCTDFDFPSECGFSPIRSLSKGTMKIKFSFLREPEVAYILEWYQEKCNVCKEDQVAAPIISTMAEKDYVLFNHYVRAVKELMKDFVPLKEATKLNLMMDLEQGQNSVVDALLLEFWKDINLQQLENLARHGNSEDYGHPARLIDDPNYFVSHINVCCLFLVSQKVSALESWTRLATFPLTCGEFGAFTKEAIEVVKIANLERIRQGQRFISVDHMLLGFSWSRIADNVRKFMDTEEASGSEELETGPNYYIYRLSQDAAAILGSDTIGLEHLFLATVFGRQATIDESRWNVFLGEKKVMEFLECVQNCEKSIGGAQGRVRRSEFEAVWCHVFPEYDGEGLIADDALSIVKRVQDNLRSNQFDPREYVNKEGYKQA